MNFTFSIKGVRRTSDMMKGKSAGVTLFLFVTEPDDFLQLSPADLPRRLCPGN